MIHIFVSKILSILFPPSCFTCKKEGEILCSKCLYSYKKPLESPLHYNTSAFCFKDTRIKKIIHAIKYFHRKDLIVPLAKVLASEIQKRNTSTSQCTRPTLVPIPMPTMRKYIRGYNQAELIAIELSKQCNYPIDTTILIKSHTTKRQATVKSRSERLRNPKGSFSTHTNVTNMSIILVDDVITTGATLEEARKTLLRAGAKSIITATLAH